jgi:hypothetical protein
MNFVQSFIAPIHEVGAILNVVKDSDTPAFIWFQIITNYGDHLATCIDQEQAEVLSQSLHEWAQEKGKTA